MQRQKPLQLELTPVIPPPAEGFSRPSQCGDTTAFRYIACLDERPAAPKAEHRNASAD